MNQTKPRRGLNVPGLCALCLILSALLILGAAGVYFWQRVAHRAVNGGDIRMALGGFYVLAGLAIGAVAMGIWALCRRGKQRSAAICAIVLATVLLTGLAAAGMGYRTLFQGLQQDEAFSHLTKQELDVAEPQADGQVLRETTAPLETAPATTEPEEAGDATAPEEENRLPAEAYAFIERIDPTGPSYLLEGAEQITNYLLFGLDEYGSSDTVMLLSLDRVHQKLKVISLARDSYVLLPDRQQFSKLTYAYSFGGAELAVRTVNSNFFLNVEDYVAVSFDQLSRIVDYLGGVTVEIDWAEYNCLRAVEGIRVGSCRLDGQGALLYARLRSTDGDLQRTARQREVLASLLAAVKGLEAEAYPRVIRDCLEMCTTSLDETQLLELCAEVVQKNYSIEQHVLPGEDIPYWGGLIGGHFYTVYDMDYASDWMYRIIYEELYISGYEEVT